MRKIICMILLIGILLSVGCKTLPESERKSQIHRAEHAMSGE